MSEPIFPRHHAVQLIIIDVQERLCDAMSKDMVSRLVKAHLALLEMTDIFEIPVAYTEQYPRGLGATIGALSSRLESAHRAEKVEFSACGNTAFAECLPALETDIILTGMETHVCVLQTAVDLIGRGHRVFVPYDAVASRTSANRDNGLALMARAGAVITNSETLVFERLKKAGGDAFKRISRAVR